ncbi:MAG: prepilin-type N-terminal cleavage/methylation domain-containing protein [Candidatus Omnitrophota bacterium]
MQENSFKRNVKGFTLTEVLITLGIFSIMGAGIFIVLSGGKSTWFDTDTSIELQQDLRIVLEKTTRELHESGFDKNGVLQANINDGVGPNGTDTLRFSIPTVCHGGDSVVDSSGDVVHWRAPLIWGCTQSSCMDADNDCNTIDYQFIEYGVDAQDQFVRKVISGAGLVVRQDIFANNISDFQVDATVDGGLVTLSISAQKNSPTGRALSAAASMAVYLRNRG